MSLDGDYRKFIAGYKKFKEGLLTEHGSEEAYFASLGYVIPSRDEKLAFIVRLLKDVDRNIVPLIVIAEPQEDNSQHFANAMFFLSYLLDRFLEDKKASELSSSAVKLAIKYANNDEGVWSSSSFSKALEDDTTSSENDNPLASFKRNKSHLPKLYVSLLRLYGIQEEILKHHAVSTREQYFEKKYGLKSFDFSSKDQRLKLFKALYDKRDGKSAILAIDGHEDIDNAEMIKALGFFLQWPDSGVYAPEISEDLFFYGAVRFAKEQDGAAMCAFRLGHHYNNGNTGRVDHNASVFWFDVATRLGHGVAPKFMYQILASEDERFGDPNEPEFNAYMDSLMQKAEDMGFPCSVEWLNRRYAFGAGKYNDQKRVVSGYENVIEEQFLAPPQLSSLMAYAMRSVLLDNVNRSYDDIVANIHAGIEKNGLQSFYTSDLEIPLRQLDKIREKLKSSNEYSSQFRALGDWISAYYNQEVTKEQFEETIGQVMALGQTSQVEAYRDALWLGRTLACEEGWKITRDIARAFERVHAVCLGLDEEQLKRSAMIMGPFYNALDPDNALPILGEYLPASQSDEEVEIQRATLGAFSPQPGIISVDAVTGENGGSITFDFKSNATSPAFILEEDIDVAMALAFGDKEKPLWPSLSLEKKDPDVLPDDYEQFCTKVWNPAWLGHTDFGKTLYIVDRLAGQLTWSPRSFTIAKSEDCFDPEFPEFAKNLLEDLRFTGGSDKSAHSKRIYVSPEFIPLEIQKSKGRFSAEKWHLPIPIKKIRINGAYTRKHGDREDRSIALNDTVFAQGRLTQRLTDHYNDVGLMMPVFERAKQLAGLTYGLMHLRSEGFKLGREFQDKASTTLEHYRNLPSLPREELVMKPQPFKSDFIS